MSNYHMIAFFAGFLLDLLIGDPLWLPHPIRWIGRWIGYLDRRLLGEKGKEKIKGLESRVFLKGCLLLVLVLLPVIFTAWAVLVLAYGLHPAAGVIAESIMTSYLLAQKCLRQESMKVYRKLEERDLPGARKEVSMIVGRDTVRLNEEGVAKAAVETVAENTSDGVIAPMLYLALGGPVLGFAYKAINTMDSMVGYKNERYFYFGKAAARLDDAVNFFPARISALLMIAAAYLSGREFSGRRAWKIFLRDRHLHASPNSAQTEAVCAGALGIRLAGDADYFGKTVKKPYIGDAGRPVEAFDIVRANRLLYRTAFFAEGIFLALLFFF